MSLTLLVAGCADRTMPVADLPEIDTSNPLLAEWETPYATPPFERIELKDYEPAFDAAIAVQRAEIEAIVKNPAKPSFHNTIVALERSGELLSRIEGLFYNLLEADSNDEMQRIALDVQPKLTALSNDIALDPALFARVKAVYENPGWFLSKEDKRLLEKTYKSFARNGARFRPTSRSSTGNIRPSWGRRRSNSVRIRWLRPTPSRSTSPIPGGSKSCPTS